MNTFDYKTKSEGDSMKTRWALGAVLLLLIGLWVTCSSPSSTPEVEPVDDMEDLVVPDGFDYATSGDVTFSIDAQSAGEPLGGALILIYHPTGGIADSDEVIGKGVTGQDGTYTRTFRVPASYGSVPVVVTSQAFYRKANVSISGGLANYSFD